MGKRGISSWWVSQRMYLLTRLRSERLISLLELSIWTTWQCRVSQYFNLSISHALLFVRLFFCTCHWNSILVFPLAKGVSIKVKITSWLNMWIHGYKYYFPHTRHTLFKYKTILVIIMSIYYKTILQELQIYNLEGKQNRRKIIKFPCHFFNYALAMQHR